MNTRSKAAKKMFKDSRNVTTEKDIGDFQQAQHEQQEALKDKVVVDEQQKAKKWGPERFRTASF